MQSADNIEKNLKAIRDLVDVDCSDVHIDDIVEHGKKLAAMIGLSAETMAASQRRLQAARLAAIEKLEPKGYPPSVLLKIAEAECGFEISLHEYADRLNAAISHKLDFLRTTVSKYKVELETATR